MTEDVSKIGTKKPKLIYSFNSIKRCFLITIESEENGWQITCTKKHHLEPGCLVSIQDGCGVRLGEKVTVLTIVSEKAFSIKSAQFQTNCDQEVYIVKLLRRSPDPVKYVNLAQFVNASAESLQNVHPKFTFGKSLDNSFVLKT